MFVFNFYCFSTILMQRFLWVFFVLIALYHIIVTILWYGILWWNSQAMISISRDAIRIVFFMIIIFSNIKQIKKYLQKRKNVRIRFVVLIVFATLTSLLNWKSPGDMMIWLKYGLYYLVVFLTASFIWFAGIKKININQISWVQRFLLWIVFFGFLRQLLKIIKPEIFMNIWYGSFDDFYFGSNPPIYYLTSFEGTTRRQWIFSGPNNYGYFLVAFLPLILLWRWKWLDKIKSIIKNPLWNLDVLFVLLRILAILMTLSRSAIIWMILITWILAKEWIRKNKKIAIWILWIFVLWIIWLSVLKHESTINHVQAKLSYVWEIVDNPLWHWLWTSWPAVHHNGTMLPENYFIQMMLDIWTVWFIFWCMVIFQILLIFKWIEKWETKNKILNAKNISELWTLNHELVYSHRKRFYIWRSILLVIWLFLHVFEDSMVNYLFFMCFGILSWYLSKIYDRKNISFKSLFLK